MFQDITNYVKNCPHFQTAKGDYVDPKTKLGTIIAHNPVDLLCIDFTKVDPSKDCKEIILVLTYAFTKFSHAFITPDQKALTIAKFWWTNGFMYMVFPHEFTSDQGCCFENQKMKHLYVMCSVEQSTTMPYNLCGNTTCERFNCTMMALLKLLSKEQKDNWLHHLPS